MSEWKSHWVRANHGIPKSRLVMRVEQAKQKALAASYADLIPAGGNYADDFTTADMRLLTETVDALGYKPTHQQLCDALDDLEFSHGTLNAALKKPKGTRNAGGKIA